MRIYLIDQGFFFFAGWLPDLGGQIGEQDAIEMIDFMLEDARQPTLGFDLGRFSMPVLELNSNALISLYITDQIGVQ